jgi:hypothetical protein
MVLIGMRRISRIQLEVLPDPQHHPNQAYSHTHPQRDNVKFPENRRNSKKILELKVKCVNCCKYKEKDLISS